MSSFAKLKSAANVLRNVKALRSFEEISHKKDFGGCSIPTLAACTSVIPKKFNDLFLCKAEHIL